MSGIFYRRSPTLPKTIISAYGSTSTTSPLPPNVPLQETGGESPQAPFCLFSPQKLLVKASRPTLT